MWWRMSVEMRRVSSFACCKLLNPTGFSFSNQMADVCCGLYVSRCYKSFDEWWRKRGRRWFHRGLGGKITLPLEIGSYLTVTSPPSTTTFIIFIFQTVASIKAARFSVVIRFLIIAIAVTARKSTFVNRMILRAATIWFGPVKSIDRNRPRGLQEYN